MNRCDSDIVTVGLNDAAGAASAPGARAGGGRRCAAPRIILLCVMVDALNERMPVISLGVCHAGGPETNRVLVFRV